MYWAEWLQKKIFLGWFQNPPPHPGSSLRIIHLPPNRDLKLSGNSFCCATDIQIPSTVHKFETHLAACIQHNPVHSNRIHASIVYCADLAIYATWYAEKLKPVRFFCISHSVSAYPVLFCGWLIDAKYAHKTHMQTQVTRCDSPLR